MIERNTVFEKSLYGNFIMNDSVVLFESSEFVSLPSKRRSDDFYGNMRLEIAEISSELDEKWASVKNVEPQTEYRHVFKLKSFEDFVAEETKRRIPPIQPSVTPKAHCNARSIVTAPKSTSSSRLPRKTVPIEAVQGSKTSRTATNMDNRQPITKVIPKPQPKQPAWIRVEDIHVPL